MRILMIDDDEKLCEAVSYQLEEMGITVDICNDGDDGLRWIRQQAHDLILLDRMLPTLSGIGVLQQMRSHGIQTPVLVMTALGAIDQRVEGLDAGADDYLVKPFAIEELLARIRAMGRRPRVWESSEIYQFGGVELDSAEKSLTGENGAKITLSKREAGLLEVFFKNPGQTMPRNVLLSRVWGPDAEVEDGNLDNYIHFLRRRLKTVKSKLQIKTVRSVGYRIQLEETKSDKGDI